MSSISFLKPASSLRSIQPYASFDCAVPTISQLSGFFAFARSPASSASSIINATARPLSRVRKESPWSLALMMRISSFFSSFSLCSSTSEVVPEVTTTALPFRSAKSLISPPFLVSRRVPTTKMVSEKAACF
ncbi:hypothetical protein D3C86_1839310 [compost metagenome]